jgi:hypothetical protein
MDKDEGIRERRPMKARPFLSAAGAVLLSLLLLAAGLLWTMDRQSPLHLAEQPLRLPRAARFVPRDADLSLHWLADPRRLPAYAQAVAPASERRDARDGARQWREGVFALAGLQFGLELEPWLGEEVSLTLTDGASNAGWVLALTSRDDDGARRFLQRFWQTRSLAGTDLQISSYRGIGVISGQGALVGHDPQPLATALIDDDLLLVASGRGVLEQALDVSQLPDQHQLGDERLQRQVADLGEGVALLTASPHALQHWLQFPEVVAQREDLNGLVASLRPEGSTLAVDGRLGFQQAIASAPWPDLTDLTASAGGHGRWLAQLQSPARLLDPGESHPLAQWFGPVLAQQLRDQPAADAVVQSDDGPLLWQDQSEGWLLATRSQSPARDAVDARLQEQGLTRSELDGDGEVLSVWTRLVRQRGRQPGVDAQLAVAQVSSSSLNWWGESLMALAQRQNGRALQPLVNQWQELASASQPVQALLLADAPARSLLGQWRPWGLLQVLAGRPLQDQVRGLAFAVDADRLEQGGTEIPLHARLELG